MKTVFNNSMVAHVWAQQKQERGKSANGQFYFEDKTIYSYGRHFPIATFLDANTVLFNDQHYSPTTGRHQSYVRRALRGGITLISSPSTIVLEQHQNLDASNSIETRKGAQAIVERKYKEIAEKHIKDAAKRKKPDLYMNDIQQAINWLDRCGMLLAFYGVNLTPETKAILDTLINDSQKLAVQYKAEIDAENKAARERKKAYKERQAARLIEEANDWRNFDRNNISFDIRGDVPTMLRINAAKGLIETSGGAEFPISDGKRAFEMIRIVKDNKGSYERMGSLDNIGNYKLGNFTIDKITPQGNVIAGCHVVAWSEIEAIARALEIYP